MTALRLFTGDLSAQVPQASPSEQPMTVSQVLDWFRARFPKNKSQEAYNEAWRLRELFRQQYGPMPYTQLSGDDLEDFTAKNGRTDKAANTIDRWYRTIKRPFKAAVKRRKILFCPFDGVESPRGAEGRDLTFHEFRTALKWATPAFKVVLAFLRFSGARPGEARTLKWPHIQAELAELAEHKTAYKTGKPRLIWWNTVTLKLIAWLKRRSSSEWVLVNSYGKPWSTRALCKNWREICDESGLPEDARLYGCRHYFATDAVVNGCDVMTLMELMGHQDIRTTRRYVHLAKKRGHMRAAGDKAIGKKPGGGNSAG